MRTVRFLAVFASVLAIGSIAAPGDAAAAEGLLSSIVGDSGACGCDDCGGCDECGNGCKRHGLGHRRRMDGTDKSFNCGCNGSYKFPVPPLYTYHWPGMYSHQLMTDYHSPWRFPPIKPYIDEPMIDGAESSAGNDVVQSPLRAVSHETQIGSRAGSPASVGTMSGLMQRLYR